MVSGVTENQCQAKEDLSEGPTFQSLVDLSPHDAKDLARSLAASLDSTQLDSIVDEIASSIVWAASTENKLVGGNFLKPLASSSVNDLKREIFKV